MVRKTYKKKRTKKRALKKRHRRKRRTKKRKGGEPKSRRKNLTRRTSLFKQFHEQSELSPQEQAQRLRSNSSNKKTNIYSNRVKCPVCHGRGYIPRPPNTPPPVLK